jgi:hypothetical protein
MRDLNIKFRGLKYNFGKVQGCFCKNTDPRDILEFTKLFSIENDEQIIN